MTQKAGAGTPSLQFEPATDLMQLVRKGMLVSQKTASLPESRSTSLELSSNLLILDRTVPWVKSNVWEALGPALSLFDFLKGAGTPISASQDQKWCHHKTKSSISAMVNIGKKRLRGTQSLINRIHDHSLAKPTRIWGFYGEPSAQYCMLKAAVSHFVQVTFPLLLWLK